jgi:hypothetical protein
MIKTIFVTLPIGLSVRNILFTGVLDRLTAGSDVRVVVFTPVPDLAERYPHTSDYLIFEPLPARDRYMLTGLLNLMLNLRFYSLNDDPALTSIKAKRRWLREISPRRHLFETILSQPLPKNKTLYRWLSALHNRRMGVSKTIPTLFDRYRPSLVFATNPTAMFEFDFLKYARSMGITTVGMIHSWDVLTTEGRIVVPLDHYLVWNQVIKGELIKIHGVSDEQITITGIPQFDVYAEPISLNRRDEFLRQQGLDPGKRTVLFGTSAGGDTPEEPEILARLVSALIGGCAGSIQLLVRLHRQDDVRRYASIEDPNVRFQIPGAQIKGLDDRRLMDQSDLRLLRDTLAYSDVLVNTASTITIDAIALDKPVVNIAFDLHETDYNRSVRRYFNMVHYQPFVNSGASKLAGSFDELVTFIQRYLGNPEFEREQRASLAATMGYRVDGKSTECIASFLLGALEGKLVRDPGMTARR